MRLTPDRPHRTEVDSMDDAPVDLVLLPGLDGSADLFAPVTAALPSWIRVTAVSYSPTEPTGYADLLPSVREAIRMHPGAFLLGWSFSGPLALMAAADADLRGVILCSSFVRPPLPLMRFLRPLVGAHLVSLLPRFVQTLMLLGCRATIENRRKVEGVLAGVPAEVIAARLRQVLSVDARDALRKCPSPVLYLAASRDLLVPRHNARNIAELRPSTETVTMGGPHLAMFTHPRAAAERLANFIARHRSGSRS